MTPKQRLFVKNYLIHRNATQAAKDAGYSEKTAKQIATENLAKPVLREAIDAGLAEIAAKLEVTAERLTAEVAKVAFADMRDFSEWGPGGVQLKESTEMGSHLTAAVSEVSETKDGVKIKLHNKLEACKMLGADLGLFNKMTIDGSITVESASDAREAMLRKLEKSAGDTEAVHRESDR